ncbi:MAG: molybdate ABC transporter substrate-binding protein [Hyphomonadaceae bacterium]|nr:molybdate ABC transporter substrate-binding protein [Hyphomonadaceae bacterium]
MLAACGSPTQDRTVTVAVASNFKTTMDALEVSFEADTGYELDIVTGSTGKLFAQITYGAPYDVFLAADQARPARLVEDGRAIAGSRFTYALGRLVLWSEQATALDAESLGASDLHRLAVANPDLAPYGRAAIQVIGALGLDAPLSTKLVLGENVGQAFAFVSTGNAQLGFVSEAQVLSRTGTERGTFWRPESDLYDPIAQDAVLITTATENPAARAFMDYLNSASAKDIIAQHGYDLP